MRRIVAAVVIGLAAFAAQAQPYVSVGAGDTSGDSAFPVLGAGYQVNKHLAAEVTHMRPTGDLHATKLAGVVRLPVARGLTALASLGVYQVEDERRQELGLLSRTPGPDRSWQKGLGLGLEVPVASKLAFRTMWEAVNRDGERDLKVLSVSLVKGF